MPGGIRSAAAHPFPVRKTLSKTAVGFSQAEAIKKYKSMVTNLKYGSAPNELDSVLQAIAHPTRREILELLTEQDLPVGKIAGQFNISRPAVIKHLRILRSANLIAVWRRGRERIQCLNPEPLATVEGWLSLASCGRKIPRFECAPIPSSISDE
jgi:DNA-binding transcriptional ArsR family regulator